MGSALHEVLEEPRVDAWAIYDAGTPVGGAVVKTGESNANEPELFFFDASLLGHGHGTRAWFALEEMCPDTRLWTTVTPMSAAKNLTFYVNKRGLHVTKIIDDDNGEKICLFEKAMPQQERTGQLTQLTVPSPLSL